MSFEVAGTSIDENLSQIGIFCPIPEDFTQDEPYTLGFDYLKDRYLNPTWVTASPDEIEESTDLDTLMNFLPRPTKVYRLKEDVARSNGLKSTWTTGGSEAKDNPLPDGTALKFPKGSRIVQVDYDPQTVVPRYERPEGSL